MLMCDIPFPSRQTRREAARRWHRFQELHQEDPVSNLAVWISGWEWRQAVPGTQDLGSGPSWASLLGDTPWGRELNPHPEGEKCQSKPAIGSQKGKHIGCAISSAQCPVRSVSTIPFGRRSIQEKERQGGSSTIPRGVAEGGWLSPSGKTRP